MRGGRVFREEEKMQKRRYKRKLKNEDEKVNKIWYKKEKCRNS